MQLLFYTSADIKLVPRGGNKSFQFHRNICIMGMGENAGDQPMVLRMDQENKVQSSADTDCIHFTIMSLRKA